jgi:hypothetical protein
MVGSAQARLKQIKINTSKYNLLLCFDLTGFVLEIGIVILHSQKRRAKACGSSHNKLEAKASRLPTPIEVIILAFRGNDYIPLITAGREVD